MGRWGSDSAEELAMYLEQDRLLRLERGGRKPWYEYQMEADKSLSAAAKPERPRPRESEQEQRLRRDAAKRDAWRRFKTAMIASGREWLLDDEDVDAAFRNWCKYHAKLD